MSFLQTLRLFLGLTPVLLWPATVYAQTPGDQPKADPPQVQIEQVQIEVDFATISTADLDKSGMTFDRVPYNQPSAGPTGPTPAGSFLHYATGERTARFLQALRHTRGDVVQAPLIATSSEVAATIHVSTQVPDRKGGFLFIQGGLTVTPRINRDESVSLYVALQASGTTGGAPTPGLPGTTLRTIRSGDVIAVDGLPLGPDRPGSDRRVLVFFSPIRLGTDAQGDEVGQRTVPMPPSQGTFPRSGKTVSVDVFNADLHTVAVMLERQFGLKASVRGSDSAYKPVYVHIDGASLAETLGAIARSAGAQIIRDEGGVYVFSPFPGSARTPIPATHTGGGSSVTVTP